MFNIALACTRTIFVSRAIYLRDYLQQFLLQQTFIILALKYKSNVYFIILNDLARARHRRRRILLTATRYSHSSSVTHCLYCVVVLTREVALYLLFYLARIKFHFNIYKSTTWYCGKNWNDFKRIKRIYGVQITLSSFAVQNISEIENREKKNQI